DEVEFNSIDTDLEFKEAIRVLQASTSTIPKTPSDRNTVDRDCYGAHDRLIVAYFYENSMYDEKLFRARGSQAKYLNHS
ncbi:hypothetical protein Tco_1349535, partial [Tanacetum coccineum]